MAYNTQGLLTDKSGKPIPQIYDPATDRYVPLTTDVYSDVNIKNLPAKQEVNDKEVKAELELVKAELQAVKEKLNGTLNTQLTGSYAEYRILSTDTFPEAKTDEKGAQLIIMDTGEIYFNHGSSWEVF